MLSCFFESRKSNKQTENILASVVANTDYKNYRKGKYKKSGLNKLCIALEYKAFGKKRRKH